MEGRRRRGCGRGCERSIRRRNHRHPVHRQHQDGGSPRRDPGPPPDLGSFEGGFNLLIVGSDTRADQGAQFGKDDGALNDVTMLVNVSAHQSNAVAVTIPRDMVVPIPACPREDGTGNHGAMSAQPINKTLAYGGLACTVLTVETLTGLKMPFAGLITFQGVIQMSTAAGGVPVCINGPLIDKYSGISLPKAGTYTLA